MHWTDWLLIVVGGAVMLAVLLVVCWAIQEILAIHWAVLMKQGG